LLLKPNKNFRSIALSSCVLKLLEKLIKARLEKLIELDCLLSCHQYGRVDLVMIALPCYSWRYIKDLLIMLLWRYFYWISKELMITSDLTSYLMWILWKFLFISRNLFVI